MADFKTHITSSVLLGAAYGTSGHLAYGMSVPSSCVAGGLVAIGGILPDVDSDNAIVLRESLAFVAAVTPMLMLQHFYAWGWTNESIVFVSGLAYIMIRFGLGSMLRRLTVHRGMWHSIPAGMIAAGIVYLMSSCPDRETRWFKTGAMFIGFLWHLLLDEIYSVETTSLGRVRIKRSFGTAIKFFGKGTAANLFTYMLLALVASAGYFEPEFAQRAHTFVESWRGGAPSGPSTDTERESPRGDYAPPAPPAPLGHPQPIYQYDPSTYGPPAYGSPSQYPPTTYRLDGPQGYR